MNRKCIECGRDFKCSPSDKTVTCSKECSRRRRSRLLKGRNISEDTRTKMRQAGAFRNNPGLLLGTAAAQESPKAGRFETNSAAKDWVLISPDGEEIHCTNLLLWVRENADMFGFDPSDDERAKRVANGFRVVKRNAQRGMKVGVTYRGWGVALTDDDRSNYEKERDKRGK